MVRTKNTERTKLVKILLLLIIIILICLIAGFVWSTQKSTSQTLDQTNKSTPRNAVEHTGKNFADCKALPESIIRQSYPEVCVTKSGERFVNPDQSARSPQ